MKHPIHRVTALEIVRAFTLRVRFEDATEQTIHFLPMLAGELYAPLRDVTLFNQVRIDPEVQTLVWPNGADFDPATLHDWPEHVAALISRARNWMAPETNGEQEQTATQLNPPEASRGR